jgi:hypothetical protein
MRLALHRIIIVLVSAICILVGCKANEKADSKVVSGTPPLIVDARKSNNVAGQENKLLSKDLAKMPPTTPYLDAAKDHHGRVSIAIDRTDNLLGDAKKSAEKDADTIDDLQGKEVSKLRTLGYSLVVGGTFFFLVGLFVPLGGTTKKWIVLLGAGLFVAGSATIALALLLPKIIKFFQGVWIAIIVCGAIISICLIWKTVAYWRRGMDWFTAFKAACGDARDFQLKLDQPA